MPNLRGKYAKLDDVVLYGDVHPSTVIHLVNRTCEIDRRLQQEEKRALLNTGNQMCTYRTCAGFQVSCLHGKNAKLGGVVLFVDTHSSTSIQSVNSTCEN